MIENCDRRTCRVLTIQPPVERILGLRMTIPQGGPHTIDDTQDNLLNGHGRLPTHDHLLASDSQNYCCWILCNRYTIGGPGSAFRRPHRANDPFTNPHVQRATGKARAQESSSADPWSSDSDSYYGYSGGTRRKKSSASARAEEEHMREAETNSYSGLWGTFPTIGVTLLFLMFAHGWGAKT